MLSPFPLYFDRYTTLEALAENLRCKPEALVLPLKQLKLHRIKKKKDPNTFREVWEIKNQAFKDVLRTFNVEYLRFIQEKLKEFPLDCAHGFIDKRSIVTNARAHIGKSFLLKCDIRDFFGSIRIERLEEHFNSVGINSLISKVISSMLCIEGKLPQGFCTSPLISNLVFLPIDKELLLLASKYDCTYTRYADDITFSSNKELPSKNELRLILSKGGFELDEKKFSLKKKGQAFYVTGLSVSSSQPTVPQKWKRILGQELYYIQKYGLSAHVGKKNYSSINSCINVIDGKIKFLNAVEPVLAKEFKSIFSLIIEKENRKITYSQKGADKQKCFMYIDECEINGIFCLGLVILEDPKLIENSLEELRINLRQKSFLAQSKGVLDKKTFHWNESSEDIREKIIELIGILPFRTYIIGEKLNGNPKNQYAKLFHELLKSRFVNLNGNYLEIFVEETNLVSVKLLQGISNVLYEESEKNNSQRPFLIPKVQMIGKGSSHALSLSDIVLGAFNKYVSHLLKPSDKKPEDKYQKDETYFDFIKPKLMTVCIYMEKDKLLWFRNKSGFKTHGIDLWSLFEKK